MLKHLKIAGGLALALLALWFSGPGLAVPPATQTLTPDVVRQLKPEMCGDSLLGKLLASIISPGRPAQSLELEQIGLVQHQPRKVWVLRLPASFIAARTCDGYG